MTIDPYKIFISHAGEDIWVAEQISACIERAGATSFLDQRDIDTGDEFQKCIKKEMPKCKELVALFTPWSRNRGWVKHEMGVADAHDLRIVCVFYKVRIKDFDKDEDGRGPLNGMNIIKLNDFANYLVQLKRRMTPAQSDTTDDEQAEDSLKKYVDRKFESILDSLQKQQEQVEEIHNHLGWRSEYKKMFHTGVKKS